MGSGTVVRIEAERLSERTALDSNRLAIDPSITLQSGRLKDYGLDVGLPVANVKYPGGVGRHRGHHMPKGHLPPDPRARGRIISNRAGWVLPTPDGTAFLVKDIRTGKKRVVSETPKGRVCSCSADASLTEACDHVWAVRFHLEGKPTLPATIVLVATPSNRSDSWHAYTEAQKAEGRLFDRFLNCLLSTVEDPVRAEGRPGRPRLSLRDGLFCTIKKACSASSCRRSFSDMEEDAAAGLISALPNWTVSSRVLSRPELTPLLLELLTFSATPLIELERGGIIAIDSTGFAAHWFGGYFLEAHGVNRDHDWVKGHLAIGTRTHIVTAAAVNERGGDSPEFPHLLRTTVAAGFEPRLVVADRGYLSHNNCAVASELGIEPRIPMKANSRPNPRGVRAWKDMYYLFHLHRDQFDDDYHQRSQVESANSALKRKMGEPLLSKGLIARRNEVLAKLIGYNLTVLIRELFRSGVDPTVVLRKGRGMNAAPNAPRDSPEALVDGCDSIVATVKESPALGG